MVLTTFQFASTALTVTVNAAPEVCGAGVPVLPGAVPGADVSPGTNNCSLTNGPAFTGMAGLVLAVFAPSVMSVAVTVALPIVLSVTLNTRLPDASAAFVGKVAPGSLEVIPAV